MIGRSNCSQWFKKAVEVGTNRREDYESAGGFYWICVEGSWLYCLPEPRAEAGVMRYFELRAQRFKAIPSNVLQYAMSFLAMEKVWSLEDEDVGRGGNVVRVSCLLVQPVVYFRLMSWGDGTLANSLPLISRTSPVLPVAIPFISWSSQPRPLKNPNEGKECL